MSQNLQNFVKFQKFQLDNLVDFEKCCKTHIFLQKSVPIQPKTNNILPKFCQELATTLLDSGELPFERLQLGDHLVESGVASGEGCNMKLSCLGGNET